MRGQFECYGVCLFALRTACMHLGMSRAWYLLGHTCNTCLGLMQWL